MSEEEEFGKAKNDESIIDQNQLLFNADEQYFDKLIGMT